MQSRDRSVVVSALNGGAACPPLLQTRTCSNRQCDDFVWTVGQVRGVGIMTNTIPNFIEFHAHERFELIVFCFSVDGVRAQLSIAMWAGREVTVCHVSSRCALYVRVRAS